MANTKKLWLILTLVMITSSGVLGLVVDFIGRPISPYFVQGLNWAATQGHSAMFGLCGILGMGLVLFCLRRLSPQATSSSRPLKAASWPLNTGFGGHVFVSRLPVGALQARGSVTRGYSRRPDISAAHCL